MAEVGAGGKDKRKKQAPGKDSEFQKAERPWALGQSRCLWLPFPPIKPQSGPFWAPRWERDVQNLGLENEAYDQSKGLELVTPKRGRGKGARSLSDKLHKAGSVDRVAMKL